MDDEKRFFVHPSSFIDEGVEIGDGTKIWYFCHIQRGSRLGKNCILGQNVNIDRDVVVGNNVKIQNNVSIYNGVTLEDDVFVGPSAVFTNVMNPRSHVPRKDEFKATPVRKGASIGANSTIVCGIEIGEYSFIGAGATVTKDVPPHALVYGNPAMIRGYMCWCGVKLRKEGERYLCRTCGRVYRLKEGGKGLEEVWKG